MTGQTVILRGDVQRDFARGLIEKAPRDAVVNIREATRTTDQNAKMWAMLSDISRHKPEGRMHTPDLWKAIFMQACGHEIQFIHGLNDQPFPVGFRSSRLNKEQMSDLIECMYEYGARHDVRWTS